MRGLWADGHDLHGSLPATSVRPHEGRRRVPLGPRVALSSRDTASTPPTVPSLPYYTAVLHRRAPVCSCMACKPTSGCYSDLIHCATPTSLRDDALLPRVCLPRPQLMLQKAFSPGFCPQSNTGSHSATLTFLSGDALRPSVCPNTRPNTRSSRLQVSGPGSGSLVVVADGEEEAVLPRVSFDACLARFAATEVGLGWGGVVAGAGSWDV